MVDDEEIYARFNYGTDNKGRQSPTFSVAESHLSFEMGWPFASRELVPKPGGSAGYFVHVFLSSEVATSATVLYVSFKWVASSAKPIF